MQVDIVSNYQEFDNLKLNWDEVHAQDPNATVFMSWPWLRGWLQSASCSWTVLCLRPGPQKQYVAFLPIAVSSLGKYPSIAETYLEMAGSPTACHKSFVILPHYNDEAIEFFVTYLKENISFDFFHLAEVHDARLDFFLSNFNPKKFKIDEFSPTPCPYIPLPCSWEEYLQYTSRNSRKRLRKALKLFYSPDKFLLKRVQRHSFDKDLVILDLLTWGPDPDPKFDKFRNVFNEFQYCYENDYFWLHILWDNLKPIAALGGFVDFNKGVFSAYNTGYDSAYAKYGPGTSILAYSIKYAIENGLKEYDFLRGDESYKTEIFKAKIRFNRNIIITKKSSKRVILGSLRKIYHKIREK